MQYYISDSSSLKSYLQSYTNVFITLLFISHEYVNIQLCNQKHQKFISLNQKSNDEGRDLSI